MEYNSSVQQCEKKHLPCGEPNVKPRKLCLDNTYIHPLNAISGRTTRLYLSDRGLY